MDTKTKIKELFGAKIQIAVPEYQRAYSWNVGNKEKMEQVDQFLEDIRDHDAEKEYYLGHYLFEKDGVCDFKYYVIDGQQRLTTTIVFMSCLINELQHREVSAIEEESIEEIIDTYLVHFKCYKFQTVIDDAKYFNSKIIERNQDAKRDNNRKSAKLIESAYNYFSNAFKDATTENLCDWYRVLSNATITTYVMDGRDAKILATQIFAFQNDRGKALTQLEKLKAYCMHQMYRCADPAQVDFQIQILEDNFSKIYSRIESIKKTSEDTILNWHCQAFSTRSGDAFSCIKNDYAAAQGNEQKKDWLLNFTSELAQTYHLMIEFENLEQGKGNRLVADICYLDRANSAPLILKLLHYDKLSYNNYSILRAIEKILFKMKFSNGDYRTNRLIDFAKQYNGTDESIVPQLSKAVDKGFQDWWDFNGACLQYFKTNTYHYRSEIKYVLYKYENFLRRQKSLPELSVDECSNIFRDIRLENTLDHITPQDPNFTTYSDDFKQRYLNNIGNLTLLTWSNNSKKSNKNPALQEIRENYNLVSLAQKEIYNVLCETGKWGEDEIESRKNKILSFIREQWGI